MMKPMFIRILLIAVLLFPYSALALDADKKAALDFVNSANSKQEISSTIYTLALSNAVMKKFIASHDRSDEVRINDEISRQVEMVMNKYGDTLNNYLADTYLAYFTPSELKSLTDNGDASQYYPKLQSHQKVIGQTFVQSIKPVLKQSVKEVVVNTMRDFGNH